MGLERNHCQSCGTQEGEFEDRDVKGIPIVLCANCRDTLDGETEQKSERRRLNHDRRHSNISRRVQYRSSAWSDRRRGERRIK